MRNLWISCEGESELQCLQADSPPSVKVVRYRIQKGFLHGLSSVQTGIQRQWPWSFSEEELRCCSLWCSLEAATWHFWKKDSLNNSYWIGLLGFRRQLGLAFHPGILIFIFILYSFRREWRVRSTQERVDIYIHRVGWRMKSKRVVVRVLCVGIMLHTWPIMVGCL